MTEFFNFLKTEYQKKNNNFYYYDSTGAVETSENSQIEWVLNGATKVVFKLKNSPSDVIKVPLKGEVLQICQFANYRIYWNRSPALNISRTSTQIDPWGFGK